MLDSSASDFDFLIGEWQVFHRRLCHRLAGNNEWEEFDGTCVTRPLLGGLGNVDDNLINLPWGPYCGSAPWSAHRECVSAGVR